MQIVEQREYSKLRTNLYDNTKQMLLLLGPPSCIYQAKLTSQSPMAGK